MYIIAYQSLCLDHTTISNGGVDLWHFLRRLLHFCVKWTLEFSFMGLFIKLSSGAMLRFTVVFGRFVRISMHQANFSPFNIVHKIDEHKAYCFIFRLMYALPGIEIFIG